MFSLCLKQVVMLDGIPVNGPVTQFYQKDIVDFTRGEDDDWVRWFLISRIINFAQAMGPDMTRPGILGLEIQELDGKCHATGKPPKTVPWPVTPRHH